MGKRHLFYFRIELEGYGMTREEAWQQAVERFFDEPGDPPPTEQELVDSPEGAPILGTEYTIDAGEEEEDDYNPSEVRLRVASMGRDQIIDYLDQEGASTYDNQSTEDLKELLIMKVGEGKVKLEADHG